MPRPLRRPNRTRWVPAGAMNSPGRAWWMQTLPSPAPCMPVPGANRWRSPCAPTFTTCSTTPISTTPVHFMDRRILARRSTAALKSTTVFPCSSPSVKPPGRCKSRLQCASEELAGVACRRPTPRARQATKGDGCPTLLRRQVGVRLGCGASHRQHHQVVARRKAGRHQNVHLVFAGSHQRRILHGGVEAANGTGNCVGGLKLAAENLAEVNGCGGGTEARAEKQNDIAGFSGHAETGIQARWPNVLDVRYASEHGSRVLPSEWTEHEQGRRGGRLHGTHGATGLSRVSHLHLHRSQRGIVGREHVELRGADVIHESRLTVHGD